MCVSSLCIPIKAIPTASVKYKERVSFCCAMRSVNGTTKGRNLMKCQKCGNEISNDAVFCSKCGMRLDVGNVQPTPTNNCIKRKWYSFQGRSTRSEWWLFNIVAYLMAFVLGTNMVYLEASEIISKGNVYLLTIVLPIIPYIIMLPVEVRRCHDVGKSGLMAYLLFFISICLISHEALKSYFDDTEASGLWDILSVILSVIYLILFGLRKGLDGDNKYGPSPKSNHKETSAWDYVKWFIGIFLFCFIMVEWCVIAVKIDEISQHKISLTDEEIHAAPFECLMESISSNDLKSVKRVFNSNVGELPLKLNTTNNKYSLTPLSHAASIGNIDIVKYLITEKHADVSYVDTNLGISTLDVAAWNGQLETVKYLAKLVPETEYSYAALCAARNGQIDVLKYFIETKGLSVDYVNTNTTRRTGVLLAEAAYNGKLNVCKYLISKGATINYQPDSSPGTHFYSALERAAQSGQLDIVKYLVEELHAKLYDALELAEKEKKAEVVKYLKATFAKEISIKEFKTKLDAIGSRYATEWKKFCDEGNLDKRIYIYSDMVMSLNSSLSKISAENLPEDIDVAFANLKMVCRHMNSCIEEFSALAAAKRKLLSQSNASFTAMLLHAGIGFGASVAGAHDFANQQITSAAATGVSALVKDLSSEEEIDTAYNNLINRVNTLNKRRYEKWQELDNIINHHL